MTPALLSLQTGTDWSWTRGVVEVVLAIAVVWLLWRRAGRGRAQKPGSADGAAATTPTAASGATAEDGPFVAGGPHVAGGPLPDGFWVDGGAEGRGQSEQGAARARKEAKGNKGTAWQWDAADDTLQVPDLFLELIGQERTAGPLTGLWLQDLILPEDRRKVRHRVRDCLAGRTSDCAFDCRILGAGNRTLHLQIQGVPRRDARGRVQALVGSFVDITRQVEVVEERDRLFNLSRDLLAIGNFAGYLQQVNPSWVRILGWSRDELMSRPLLEFVHPRDQERAAVEIAKLADGQPTDEFQVQFRCRNGAYRWLSWSSFPYPGRRLVFSAVRDITAQKEAEAQLLEYQGRLRSLTAQLARVEDRQRRELAAAIHDGLAQQLFGIRAQVSLLTHPAMAGKTGELVPEILTLLDDTMQEARTLSFALLPPVLSEAGLAPALEWLARSFTKRTGISCTVDDPQDDDDLPQEIRGMVFQSVRELLTNVHKHARAKDVTITLSASPQELFVAVTDDGVGFDPDVQGAPADDGTERFGLFSLRERMRAAGGTFTLESAPGSGCTATLILPLDHTPLRGPAVPEAGI